MAYFVVIWLGAYFNYLKIEENRWTLSTAFNANNAVQKIKEFLNGKIAGCLKKYSKRAPYNIWNISSESHLEVTLTGQIASLWLVQNPLCSSQRIKIAPFKPEDHVGKNSYSKRAIIHKPCNVWGVDIFWLSCT